MFLQGFSIANPQIAGGNLHQLQGPPSARDFTVPGVQVSPPQPFVFTVEREFLTPSVADVFWDSKDVQDKQDGLLSNSVLDDCHHIN